MQTLNKPSKIKNHIYKQTHKEKVPILLLVSWIKQCRLITF